MRMWQFLIFLLLIALLSQGGNCATKCYCESDESSEFAPNFNVDFKGMEFETEPKQITLESIESTVLDKIRNQLEKMNARNEILYYRLETLRERFEVHDRLLRKCSEKDSQADVIIEEERPKPNRKFGLDDEEKGYQQNITCPKTKTYPRNCAEAIAVRNQSGIYTIQIESFSSKPFLVYCDDRTHDGNWTLIQRRMDGSIDFYRDWNSYKTGFGNLDGEFFIGLDKLHALTTDKPQELLITLGDFEGVTKYAKYDAFAIGNEAEQYALKVLGAYSGDAGNSLSHHAGQMFTTKDKQNDQHKSNCAVQYKGAWWYRNCHESNLNGLYLHGNCAQNQTAQGVVWVSWHGYDYSLKNVQILIRPKKEN